MNRLKRLATLILVTLIMLVPNLRAYSLAGVYSYRSPATIANSRYVASQSVEKAVFPAVLAVAAGVGLAIVFAVGVIDGWNSIHPQAKILKVSPSFNPNDFSKYDA